MANFWVAIDLTTGEIYWAFTATYLFRQLRHTNFRAHQWRLYRKMMKLSDIPY